MSLVERSWSGGMRLGLGVWLQLALLATLVLGAVAQRPAVEELAGALAGLWALSQWRRLLPLARLFVALAGLSFALVLLLAPAEGPRLVTALVQGTGFAALMMVLGLLRQPVKRAEVTRAAAQYLLSAPPRRRYGVLLSGAQFMALIFNVGIIAMIGDLTRDPDHEGPDADPGRRAMVMAAQRGAALVAVWSPMSLGFAIVTTGIPAVAPLALIGLAFAFTMLVLALSAFWPLLPAAARLPRGQAGPRAGRAGAVGAVLAVSAGLLAANLTLHHLTGFGFTLCSVIVLPLFALVWLALERDGRADFGTRLGQALAALADLRNEGTLFLAANVIGAALSLAIQSSPLWPLLSGAALSSLPALLGLLVLIPLAAALYLPNTIMVVLAAQIFGPTLLGQAHPLALGLTLCIGWGLAICINPISAMNLIVGRFAGVPAAQVAHRWNAGFVAATGALAALTISLVYRMGG
ncbi:hypothetical protein KM176_15980 [Pseudooceanicola sp. CBS1P-1]|uniref:Uncharacterized protein n=1 Tax=Pseudooceanicola albus TaxID=2692189 RepID=A0A6L7G4J3_9RHOB|nr:MULTISPECIES: hypothetical protein [Pseudooceanicola]MBT9385372.1 hypothetical protein [Pseudooceanicola endophyticus]MXN18769.1 hypothetical protein [Pseudooceanicola albus]